MVSFPNVSIRALFGLLIFIAAMSALAGLVSLQERAEILNSQERSSQQLLAHRHNSDEHINATNTTLDTIQSALTIQNQTANSVDAHINVTEENNQRINEILERIERLEIEVGIEGVDAN